MNHLPIPFHSIDWSAVEKTTHPGQTGAATWQTKQYNGLRIRLVEYTPGYLADHWCSKGHIVHCLEGTFESELQTGERFTLTKGMTYVVSDDTGSHRSITQQGVKLLIIDGDFLNHNSMTIENSTAKDIDQIFQLYHEGTEYMKGRSLVVWPEFDRHMVQQEIAAKHQWKMISNNSIACVWATTFSDAQIWEERNADAAVYIHRIAVHPHFRGKNLVLQIVEWAKDYARAHNKKLIRLDTVGDNKGLIKHYTACGFNFLGLFKLKNTAGLPPHYDNATVSLFELAVN